MYCLPYNLKTYPVGCLYKTQQDSIIFQCILNVIQGQKNFIDRKICFRQDIIHFAGQLQQTPPPQAKGASYAPDVIILNCLNKKESKIICLREFEIILFQTQSLSINHKAVQFYKEHFKTSCEAFVVEFYLKLYILRIICLYITYNKIPNIYIFGKLVILFVIKVAP